MRSCGRPSPPWRHKKRGLCPNHPASTRASRRCCLGKEKVFPMLVDHTGLKATCSGGLLTFFEDGAISGCVELDGRLRQPDRVRNLGAGLAPKNSVADQPARPGTMARRV